MTRGRRDPPGGYTYHVLNRANAGATIFGTDADYHAFIKLIRETMLQTPIRLIDYCVMPNHWHLLAWPEADGQLARFMHRLETTHAHRWHAFRGSSGRGHLYQGPYKFFPVEDEDYYLAVRRYIVRNPLRAGLVERAEHWKWSSLWAREHPWFEVPELTDGVIEQPADWVNYVNAPQTEAEVAAIRECIRRNRPFGTEEWQVLTADRLGLDHTMRRPGRPRRI